VTRDAYPPLRPQPGRRATTGSVPPLLVGGVVLLVLIALVLLLMLLTREGGGAADASGSPGLAAGSPSASASASASASGTESASASASASASGSAAPAPSVEPIPVDTIVTAAVDRLAVRSAPGTGAERLGSIAAGTESFVVEGPTEADGFQWYLISALGLPPNTGCEGPSETDPFNCPVWFGWSAGVSNAGEPYLQPEPQECPAAPVTAEALIFGRTDLQRLACAGGEAFTFRAWYPELPEDGGLGGACPPADEPSGWLLCAALDYNQVTIDESQGFGGIGAFVAIDPATGVAMPERDNWVELTVHMDDPAAQGCDDAAMAHDSSAIPQQAVLTCRATMVVESVTVVEGP
jgi:hypothetical protein